MVKDSSGDVRYFGEVVNNGTPTHTFVKITFTTYDASNQVIGVDYSYIHGNLWMTSSGSGDDTALGAAEFGSFEVYTSVPYATSNTYVYTITSSSYATTAPKYALAINGTINELTWLTDYKKYLGEVVNNGTGTASFVKISFTTKDASGLVNGTDYTYIAGTTCTHYVSTDTCLAAGAKGSFEVSTLVKATDIASYYYRIYHEEYAVTKPSFAKTFAGLDHDQRLQAWNLENENKLKQVQAAK